MAERQEIRSHAHAPFRLQNFKPVHRIRNLVGTYSKALRAGIVAGCLLRDISTQHMAGQRLRAGSWGAQPRGSKQR